MGPPRLSTGATHQPFVPPPKEAGAVTWQGAAAGTHQRSGVGPWPLLWLPTPLAPGGQRQCHMGGRVPLPRVTDGGRRASGGALGGCAVCRVWRPPSKRAGGCSSCGG